MNSSIQKDPPQEPATTEWPPEARAGIELLKQMFKEYYLRRQHPALVPPAEKDQ